MQWRNYTTYSTVSRRMPVMNRPFPAGIRGTGCLWLGLRFHEFHAGAVRVEKVELPLAVAAHARLDVGVFVVARDGSFAPRLNVRHFETDVMHGTVLLPRGRSGVQHQLDVIAARARSAHVDPGGLLAGRASAPELDKVELVTIERERGVRVGHGDSGVIQVRGDPPLQILAAR